MSGWEAICLIIRDYARFSRKKSKNSCTNFRYTLSRFNLHCVGSEVAVRLVVRTHVCVAERPVLKTSSLSFHFSFRPSTSQRICVPSVNHGSQYGYERY